MSVQTLRGAISRWSSPWIIGAALVAGCDDGPTRHVHEISGATMGTHYNVKLVDLPDDVDPDALAARINLQLEDIDARLSTWRPDSELSRFNQSRSTDWFEIGGDTHYVVEAAQQISRLTDGAFDVTVGPLVNLWGFGPDGIRDAPPNAIATAQALERTGYDRLALRPSPPAIRKQRPDVYVDLSAIAKGYAVDRVAALLDEQGVADYLVEVGGELRARGHNPQGERWAIAVERPAASQRSVHRVIRIGDRAVATSGDYRNFFEHGGRRYSHTIDPRTGASVTHELASVTVIGESAMHVDALATALSVLGPDAGFELATREGIAALFVSRNGQGFSERSTESFDKLVVTP